MSEDAKPQPGMIVWTDLTVTNAEEVRDFYAQVVGWEPAPVDMGEYKDFGMNAPDTGVPVSGVCHARGANANLPSQWMIYVTVASVEESAKRCVDGGGKVIDGPRLMGKQPFCVIQDPAGAVLGLIEE